MKLKKFYSQKVAVVVAVIALVILLLVIRWVHILNVAHSTFENYYAFRGCEQLLERTTTSGTCVTFSGQTIKIVEFNGKWYLDGDLPSSGFNFL